MDEKVLDLIMPQFAALHERFDKLEVRMDRLEERVGRLEQRQDRLERQMADDRVALMETLRTIDGRFDRLEQLVEAQTSRINDISVRHRHLVHKVAELEEAVAIAKAE